jgi:hypothetical protein
MANRNMDQAPLAARPEADPVEQGESMHQKRPFGVTLLLWLVLSLSVWGLLRFAGALRWWDVLYEKGSRLSPLYLSITGAGWVLAAIVLLWSIWSAKRWAYLAVPGSVLIWLVQYWLERSFFQAQRSNLTFSIIASIVLIVITLISTFNQRTKKFLTKSEEHEQPEKHSTPA